MWFGNPGPNRIFLCAVALASQCLSRPACAYRPFDGTDAAVAEEGEIELELGPVGVERAEQTTTLTVPALVANYGMAPDLELVLEGNHEVSLAQADHRAKSALKEPALLVKSVLKRGSLQGGSGLSLAIESGVLLPSPDAQIGAHLASILSMRWPALTVHLNLNDDFVLPARYEPSASVIVEGPLAWRLRPVAEALVTRAISRGVQHSETESLLFGALFRQSEALVFDAAIRVADTPGGAAFEGRLGFTWAFQAHTGAARSPASAQLRSLRVRR